MKIYLSADHNGFYLRQEMYRYLTKHGYDTEVIGGDELDPKDDFPELAEAAVVKVLHSEDKDPRAILLCGGGQGMCMAANRHHGIRAAVVWDAHEAKMSRNDNDSNVLCLPARIFSQEDDGVWQGIVETWLNTPFASAARYVRRNRQLDELGQSAV